MRGEESVSELALSLTPFVLCCGGGERRRFFVVSVSVFSSGTAYYTSFEFIYRAALEFGSPFFFCYLAKLLCAKSKKFAEDEVLLKLPCFAAAVSCQFPWMSSMNKTRAENGIFNQWRNSSSPI